MKANELRIGNYVMDQDETNDIFQVNSIEIGVGRTEGMSFINKRWNRDINPIPLTEKWLLKFGFTKYDWCNDCAFIKFNHGHLMLRYYRDKWHCTKTKVAKDNIGQKTSGHTTIIKDGLIKYVHQLQNLYFTLTGEELKENL